MKAVLYNMKMRQPMMILSLVLLICASICGAIPPPNSFAEIPAIRFLLEHKPETSSGIVVVRAHYKLYERSNLGVAISESGGDDNWQRCIAKNNAAWLRSGIRTIKISARGFQTQIIDSVPIPPPDSLIVLTFDLTLGEGEKRTSIAHDTLVDRRAFDVMRFLAGIVEDDSLQNVLMGTLIDESSGQPIAGANLYCDRAGRGACTDDSGRYLLNLWSTTASNLRVVHPSYDTLNIFFCKSHRYSTKRIDIYYQGPRDGRPAAFDPDNHTPEYQLTALLSLTSFGLGGREEGPNLVYTFLAGTSGPSISLSDSMTSAFMFPYLSWRLRGYSDWIEFLDFLHLAFRSNRNGDVWPVFERMSPALKDTVLQGETSIQISIRRQIQ